MCFMEFHGLSLYELNILGENHPLSSFPNGFQPHQAAAMAYPEPLPFLKIVSKSVKQVCKISADSMLHVKCMWMYVPDIKAQMNYSNLIVLKCQYTFPIKIMFGWCSSRSHSM